MNATPPPTANLGNAVARGAAWTVGFRLADRGIGLVSTLVLARLLVPADFGLIAMATTLMALIEVVTVGEFGSAIIHNPNVTRDHYDSAWSMSALFGLTAAILLITLAYPTAAFFKEPRLVPVICALSLLPIMDGLFNMGCVDFRKHLQFHKDFQLQVGRKIIGFLIVIPLAFVTRSYWALIAGMIAGRAAGLVLSYLLHPFRPRFSLRSARSLFRYSAWLMLNNALTFLSQRGAHLVVGRLLTPQALGLYTVSYEMAHLPTTEMAMPVNRAIFPGYSKLQNDRAALQSAFLRVLGVMAVVTIPAGLGMACIAHLFVPAILGAKWLAAAPLISVLALAGTINALQANIESVYLATGHPRLKAVMTLLEVACFLPLLLLLVPRYELMGAANALVITASVAAPVNYLIALKLLRLAPTSLAPVLWRPLVAALIMTAALLAVFPQSVLRLSSLENLWVMFGAILLGASVYGLALFSMWLASRATRRGRAVDLDTVPRPAATCQAWRNSRIAGGKRPARSRAGTRPWQACPSARGAGSRGNTPSSHDREPSRNSSAGSKPGQAHSRAPQTRPQSPRCPGAARQWLRQASLFLQERRLGDVGPTVLRMGRYCPIELLVGLGNSPGLQQRQAQVRHNLRVEEILNWTHAEREIVLLHCRLQRKIPGPGASCPLCPLQLQACNTMVVKIRVTRAEGALQTLKGLWRVL